MCRPIDRVLEKLESVKKTGSGFVAVCPSHEDKKPSLNIREGKDGCVLVKCHAGCKTEDVVAKLGMEMRDLFPNKPGRASGKSRANITAVYAYHAADGELVYEKVRYDTKKFRQRRPSDDGGYIWNLKGVDMVLCRLPEIIAADPADFVFICEGEKDVDILSVIGLVATTNPGGAMPTALRRPMHGEEPTRNLVKHRQRLGGSALPRQGHSVCCR